MIIPESSVQLTDIYSNETVNRLLKEAEEFLPRINQIEIIGPLKTVNSIDFLFLFFERFCFVFRSFKLKQRISIFYQVLI
jgi:hypothetical protein